MKTQAQRKYSEEQFNNMLPLLIKLIHKVKLNNKAEKYHINGIEFLIKHNKDVIEMSLAAERPIFPTLAFRPVSDLKADLLYYRIGEDFKNCLREAVA